jgi:hypothetical protein
MPVTIIYKRCPLVLLNDLYSLKTADNSISKEAKKQSN